MPLAVLPAVLRFEKDVRKVAQMLAEERKAPVDLIVAYLEKEREDAPSKKYLCVIGRHYPPIVHWAATGSDAVDFLLQSYIKLYRLGVEHSHISYVVRSGVEDVMRDQYVVEVYFLVELPYIRDLLKELRDFSRYLVEDVRHPYTRLGEPKFYQA